MEARLYNMIQEILDSYSDYADLKECYTRVADNLTEGCLQKRFPEVLVTKELAAQIRDIWRPIGNNSVYAYCCGSPILYAEHTFGIGKASVERLAATEYLLSQNKL